MKNHIFLLHILPVFFTLTACVSLLSNSPAPTLIPPNEFTQAYEPLSEEAVSSLVEMTSVNSSSLNSPLLKVGYISEDNIILGIYSDGGTVAGWEADTATIAFTHKLGIVTSKGLALIESGKNLIGATKHNFKPQNIEYVNGIALWDVRTGVLIRCITYPCQGTSTSGDGFLGLAVSDNGKWLAIYSESGIGISGVSDDTPSLYYNINDVDFSYPWDIGSVAFDEKHRRYAVVFQEGRVYVSNNETSTNYHTIAKGTKGDGIVVADAQIDPTGRWLVVARGDKTQVRNLDNGKVLFQIGVSNPVLSFNQTGELLFVGSENKLAIYSIDTAEKIAEYDAVGITSLAISEDNRIVIWGDVQGAIHIWAKPLPNP